MRFALAIVVGCAALMAPVRAADDLKVVVIDGDEAANIVAERLAAVPIVEVRDKDDRRVPGAVVRFLIRKARNRLIATFRNGQAEVRTITDAAGQANSSAIVPLEPGTFEIEVEVSYSGESGKAVFRQTNFRTVADAKAAGREPGKSTSSNAQPSTAGATTTATPTAASAPTLPPAAIAASGGMSKVAVIGLAVGGAAGAGAAVALSRKESEPAAGRVTSLTASVTSGIQAATAFAFSAQAADFDQASIRYRWEFGDGASSADPAPNARLRDAGRLYRRRDGQRRPAVRAIRDRRDGPHREWDLELHELVRAFVGPVDAVRKCGHRLHHRQQRTNVPSVFAVPREWIGPYRHARARSCPAGVSASELRAADSRGVPAEPGSRRPDAFGHRDRHHQHRPGQREPDRAPALAA